MTVSLLGGGGHASDVLSVVEALIAEGCAEGPVWVADDRWDRPDRFDQRCVKVVESIEAGARLAPYIVSVGYPKGRVRSTRSQWRRAVPLRIHLFIPSRP